MTIAGVSAVKTSLFVAYAAESLLFWFHVIPLPHAHMIWLYCLSAGPPIMMLWREAVVPFIILSLLLLFLVNRALRFTRWSVLYFLAAGLVWLLGGYSPIIVSI